MCLINVVADSHQNASARDEISTGTRWFYLPHLPCKQKVDQEMKKTQKTTVVRISIRPRCLD